MPWLCSSVTTQSFAEFAQNLYMCTPKLEKSCIFIFVISFFHLYLMLLFKECLRLFLRKIFNSNVLTVQIILAFWRFDPKILHRCIITISINVIRQEIIIQNSGDCKIFAQPFQQQNILLNFTTLGIHCFTKSFHSTLFNSFLGGQQAIWHWKSKNLLSEDVTIDLETLLSYT